MRRALRTIAHPEPSVNRQSTEAAGGDKMLVSECLNVCAEDHCRWSDVEACAADRKVNNTFFVTAFELLIDLIVFGKFPPYNVDPVVFGIVSHVYEHYEEKEKEWPTHHSPCMLLSNWTSKVLSRVTEVETTDVVEFISDTVNIIKQAVRCNHHIEATYVHRLATDVLRYRLVTVDTEDSWK